MARIAQFSEEQILEAALDVVVNVGPRDATLAAVSTASGAPIGSIYHRFKSKEALMGRLWIETAEAFLTDYVGACQHGPGAAASEVVQWTSRTGPRAKILLLHPSEAFVAEPTKSPLRNRFREHRALLQSVLHQNTKAWLGSNSIKKQNAVRLATVEMPMGAVRQRLSQGEEIPKYLGAWVACAAEAVIAEAKGAK